MFVTSIVISIFFAITAVILAFTVVNRRSTLQPPQKILTVFFVGFWFGVWIGIYVWLHSLGWKDESLLWNVAMSGFSFLIIANTFSALDQDEMILSKYLASVHRIDASREAVAAWKQVAQSRQLPIGNVDAGDGMFGTYFVPNFPLPLAQGYRLPLSEITVYFAVMNAITIRIPKDDAQGIEAEAETPVSIFLSLQILLGLDLIGLQDMARYLGILKGPGNLRVLDPDEVQVFQGMDEEKGTPILKPQKCSRIVKRFADALQGPFEQAASEAISDEVDGFGLSEAMKGKQRLELAIRGRLKDTLVQRAGLLRWVPGPNSTEATKPGPACLMFDINIIDVVPSNKETYLALSAETREQRTAKGVIAQAEGKARAMTIESKAVREAGDAGARVLAAKTLEKLPANTTLIAGVDVVSAAAANLLGRSPQQENQRKGGQS